MNYQTLKQANYTYLKYHKKSKKHTLRNNETGDVEAFTATKNYSGWALIYKNTHLEFCYTVVKN